jgi:NAD(P)H-hydrate epimerase
MAEHREESLALLKESKRQVVLTPHPLEFARLIGTTARGVQSGRIGAAEDFVNEYGCTLILKGAGTVIASRDSVYINSTGSSALSKAGTGDVLAGVVASLIASGGDVTPSSAAAVYYHGLAADVLADELSVFGVTPSDLPREIARQISEGQRKGI